MHGGGGVEVVKTGVHGGGVSGEVVCVCVCGVAYVYCLTSFLVGRE